MAWKEVILHEGSTSKGNRTTSTKLYVLKHDTRTDLYKKFRLTYECYNCGETFIGELFNGDKFKKIFDMEDLGITLEANYYLEFSRLKPRIDMLFKEGVNYIKLIFE